MGSVVADMQQRIRNTHPKGYFITNPLQEGKFA